MSRRADTGVLTDAELEDLTVALRYGMGTMPGSYIATLKDSTLPVFERILAAREAEAYQAGHDAGRRGIAMNEAT